MKERNVTTKKKTPTRDDDDESRVEFPRVRVQIVHPALFLRRGGPDLEADGAVVHLRVSVREGLDPHVLKKNNTHTHTQ